MARKSRAAERGNLIKTGGGPSTPPQQGAIINMVEEAAPLMICEVKNSFDSDGAVLTLFENKDKVKDTIDNNCSIDISEGIQLHNSSKNIESETDFCVEEITEHEAAKECIITTQKDLQAEQRKPSDYVRREAVLRIKHLEMNKKIERQILKTKLEIEEIKKRAAEMEEERSRNLLEMSKLELLELKKRLGLSD